MKKQLTLLVFLFLCRLGLAAEIAPNFQSTFDAGLASFEAGKYDAAAGSFEALLAAGYETAAQHFNLGDTYYREKNIGKSIFHFRRAQDLAPRDPDIKFNLRFARKQAVDRIEDKEDNSFLQSLNAFNEKESFWFLIFAAIFFWGFAIARLLLKEKFPKWVVGAALGVFVLAIGMFSLREVVDQPYGVVTNVDGPVYSGFGVDKTLLFTLHPGAEFQILSNRDALWLELRLADGKKGWLLKTDAARSEN
jgi:tetratricopeptide (TPR) repeat protein